MENAAPRIQPSSACGPPIAVTINGRVMKGPTPIMSIMFRATALPSPMPRIRFRASVEGGCVIRDYQQNLDGGSAGATIELPSLEQKLQHGKVRQRFSEGRACHPATRAFPAAPPERPSAVPERPWDRGRREFPECA